MMTNVLDLPLSILEFGVSFVLSVRSFSHLNSANNIIPISDVSSGLIGWLSFLRDEMLMIPVLRLAFLDLFIILSTRSVERMALSLLLLLIKVLRCSIWLVSFHIIEFIILIDIFQS